MFYDSSGCRYPSVDDHGIYGFYGDYRFLSNFHVCNFKLDGLNWTSSEAAYMACKSNDIKIKELFAGMGPKEAKQIGRTIQPLIPDWDTLKVFHMTRILFAKFGQNPNLCSLLKDTGDKYLEETNDWGDLFWGADIFGKGHNMLGKTLMIVRENI